MPPAPTSGEPTRHASASPVSAGLSARARTVGLFALVVVAWAVLALTLGASVSAAAAEHSGPIRLVTAVAFWVAWVGGLVALLVPHPLSLTALRLLAPTAVAAALWAAIATPDRRALALLSVVVAVAAASLALLPAVADRCVDGSSYGPETRMALRVPLPLLLGPLPLAWAVTVLGVLTGPLLLAARQWIAGGLALIVGFAGAAFAARSVHGLAERFVVFVPAGFVLHDRAVLFDPVLFARHRVARIGAAEVGTGATDLTLRSAGLVIEVQLTEAVEASLRAGRKGTTTTELDSLLICPLRPGAFLRTAREHRLPVG